MQDKENPHQDRYDPQVRGFASVLDIVTALPSHVLRQSGDTIRTRM